MAQTAGSNIQEEVEIKFTLLIIVIIGLVLLVVAGYFFNKKVLPSDLIEKARVANVDISDFGLLKLRAKAKFNIEEVLQQIIRANLAGISLKVEDVKDILLGDVDLEVIISSLISAHRSRLDINIYKLYQHSLINKDIDEFVKAKIKIKHAKLDELITDERLEDHLMSGGDMVAFVDNLSKATKSGVKIDMDELMEADLDKEGMTKILNNLIRAKKVGVYIANDEVEELSDAFHSNRISQSGLLQIYADDKKIEDYVEAMIKAHKFGITDLLLSDLFEFALTKDADVLETVDALIKAKRADLDLTLHDIMVFSINHGDVKDFVEAYMIAKNSNLGLSIDELEKHQLSGGKVLYYVKALKIAKVPGIEISKKEIESHSLKGGNVLNCAVSILRAKEFNVKLTWSTATMIDLGGRNPVEVIKESVNPKVIHVPAFNVVGKDGIVLKVHASIAVILKIEKYFSGAGEATLFERVSEAIIHEISNYEDNKSIVKNLNTIAKKAFKHLHQQHEVNSQSKFILEDITIPEIEAIDDIYSHIKKEHAEIHAITQKTTAESELLAAEAKVENAFAEAIKSGKVNDYYKHKIYKEKKEEEKKKDGKENKHSGGHHDSHNNEHNNAHDAHNDSHESDNSNDEKHH